MSIEYEFEDYCIQLKADSRYTSEEHAMQLFITKKRLLELMGSPPAKRQRTSEDDTEEGTVDNSTQPGIQNGTHDTRSLNEDGRETDDHSPRDADESIRVSQNNDSGSGSDTQPTKRSRRKQSEIIKNGDRYKAWCYPQGLAQPKSAEWVNAADQ